jgi:hypothetical protein
MPTRSSARSSALGKRADPSAEQRPSEPEPDVMSSKLPLPLAARPKRRKQLDEDQRPRLEQAPSRFPASSLAVLALTALANAADERRHDRNPPSMSRMPAVPAPPPTPLALHTGDRPFICDSCGASFALKGSLKKHVRGVHTGSKPYQCDICGRTFSQSSNLNVHRRLHQDDRPHECTMCGARFAQSGTLSKHIRVHTGEKVHRPAIRRTGRARTPSALTLIITVILHLACPQPFACEHCDAKFSQRANLNVHCSRQHAAPPASSSSGSDSVSALATGPTHTSKRSEP